MHRSISTPKIALSVAGLLAALAHGCGGAVSQAPPTASRAELRSWIDAGHYRMWRCESERHAARSPSPHGQNRICSNDLLSAAAATGDYPVGAASVKELFSDTGMLIGHAVGVRTSAATGGAGWFWYEYVPAGTMLPTPNPVEADGTVAFGLGNSGGNAQMVCTGCHTGAPRDLVFTQVR